MNLSKLTRITIVFFVFAIFISIRFPKNNFLNLLIYCSLFSSTIFISQYLNNILFSKQRSRIVLKEVIELEIYLLKTFVIPLFVISGVLWLFMQTKIDETLRMTDPVVRFNSFGFDVNQSIELAFFNSRNLSILVAGNFCLLSLPLIAYFCRKLAKSSKHSTRALRLTCFILTTDLITSIAVFMIFGNVKTTAILTLVSQSLGFYLLLGERRRRLKIQNFETDFDFSINITTAFWSFLVLKSSIELIDPFSHSLLVRIMMEIFFAIFAIVFDGLIRNPLGALLDEFVETYREEDKIIDKRFFKTLPISKYNFILSVFLLTLIYFLVQASRGE